MDTRFEEQEMKYSGPSEDICTLFTRVRTLPLISEISLRIHDDVIGQRQQK